MREQRRVVVGSIVEVLPGYDHETRDRTRWDEIAGCEALVIMDYGSDLEIRIKGTGDEYAVARSRLRWTGGRSEG